MIARYERRGETVIELLMTYVAPVVGGIIASVILIQLTGWPQIVCIAIGLPVGTILGWIVLVGLLVTIGVIFKAKK
jgi:hypothetical protein